jgi:hypothetical protein
MQLRGGRFLTFLSASPAVTTITPVTTSPPARCPLRPCSVDPLCFHPSSISTFAPITLHRPYLTYLTYLPACLPTVNCHR